MRKVFVLSVLILVAVAMMAAPAMAWPKAGTAHAGGWGVSRTPAAAHPAKSAKAKAAPKSAPSALAAAVTDSAPPDTPPPTDSWDCIRDEPHWCGQLSEAMAHADAWTDATQSCWTVPDGEGWGVACAPRAPDGADPVRFPVPVTAVPTYVG